MAKARRKSGGVCAGKFKRKNMGKGYIETNRPRRVTRPRPTQAAPQPQQPQSK